MTQSRPVPPPRPEASQRRDDGSSNVAWDPFLTKNRRGPDPEGARAPTRAPAGI